MTPTTRRRRALPLATLAAATLLAGCQTAPPTSPAVVGEYRAGSGYLNGYLDRKALPDSLALLPPPPAGKVVLPLMSGR